MILVVPIIFCFSCSKSNSSAPPNQNQKDYTALFKNKVWTGEFNISSGSLPYSMAFTNGDSVILYVSFKGVNRGSYTLENNKLTCSFYNVKIAATVTEADTLAQIQTIEPGGWTVLSGKLNTTTPQQLDNTKWIGKNPYNSNQDTIVLEFKPGGVVRVSDMYNVSYTREAARIHFSRTGVGPAFDQEFYFIHMDDRTLKGQRDSNGRHYYFEARKQ